MRVPSARAAVNFASSSILTALASGLTITIAHEIGQSLFRDCAEIVRHRIRHSRATRDEWQLKAPLQLRSGRRRIITFLTKRQVMDVFQDYGRLHRNLSASPDWAYTFYTSRKDRCVA
jgi:hypothetical protein